MGLKINYQGPEPGRYERAYAAWQMQELFARGVEDIGLLFEQERRRRRAMEIIVTAGIVCVIILAFWLILMW